MCSAAEDVARAVSGAGSSKNVRVEDMAGQRVSTFDVVPMVYQDPSTGERPLGNLSAMLARAQQTRGEGLADVCADGERPKRRNTMASKSLPPSKRKVAEAECLLPAAAKGTEVGQNFPHVIVDDEDQSASISAEKQDQPLPQPSSHSPAPESSRRSRPVELTRPPGVVTMTGKEDAFDAMRGLASTADWDAMSALSLAERTCLLDQYLLKIYTIAQVAAHKEEIAKSIVAQRSRDVHAFKEQMASAMDQVNNMKESLRTFEVEVQQQEEHEYAMAATLARVSELEAALAAEKKYH